MKLLKKPIFYLIFLILIISGVVFYKTISGKSVNVEGKYDDFAKYLTKKGVKMYGTEWCAHCNNQKKLFGSSFQYINYVDCDKKPEECNMAGVRGYPTWQIDGKNYPGTQTLDRLARLTGYENKL